MKPLRWILLAAGYAGTVLASSGGTSFAQMASEAMEDDARRAKIEAMYRDYKKKFPGVQDIAPAEASQLLDAGRALFVDVREPKEQEVSMLPGAVTEKEFLSRPGGYGDMVVIGYCTISYRSGKLAEKLKERGITMLNLKGGLLAWVHAGGKVYDQAGETRRIHVYGRKWDLGPKDYQPVW
jgi:sodium/bile acid cotransporter 7